MSDQQFSATIYKQLFTGAEWDAIAFAMKDYGDFHGGVDEDIAKDEIKKGMLSVNPRMQ